MMDAELAQRIRLIFEREIKAFSELLGRLIREAVDSAPAGTRYLYGPTLGCSNLLRNINLIVAVESGEIRLISSPMPDVVFQLTGDTVSMNNIESVAPESQNDMTSVLTCYNFQYAHSRECSQSSADFVAHPR